MAVVVRALLDGDSIPALGSESRVVDVDNQGRIRPVVALGADVTAKVQTSVDEAATWYDLASYPAGATGVQDIIDLPGALVRVVVTNGSALLAQTATAHLIIERD